MSILSPQNKIVSEPISAATVYLVADMAEMLGGFLHDVCEALKESVMATSNKYVWDELEAIRQFSLQHGDITFVQAGEDHFYMTPAREA